MKALVLTSDGTRPDYLRGQSQKLLKIPSQLSRKKDYYIKMEKVYKPVACHLAQHGMVEGKIFCVEKIGAAP